MIHDTRFCHLGSDRYVTTVANAKTRPLQEPVLEVHEGFIDASVVGLRGRVGMAGFTRARVMENGVLGEGGDGAG